MLLTHALVNDIATKAVVIFLRLVTGGEPARAFVAIDLFKDCPLFLESLVERARFHRPAVQAIEVGEGDLVAEQVVFSRLDVLPLFVGVVAESARVKGAHRHIGRAMHHPAGQFTGQARTPANTNLRAAAAPVIAHTRCGANQRVAVRRVRNRAMHILPDAELGKYGHTIERVLKPGHDAVVVGLKQEVLGLPGAVIVPDHVGIGFFINTDQPALLLHADVTRDQFVVANHGQLFFDLEKLGHRLGHEVVMGHGRRGDVNAAPFTDLPCIGAAGIHHVFAGDVTVLGGDLPLPTRQLRHVGGAAMANDRSAQLAGTLGEAQRHTRRVHMAVVGGM